MTQQSSGREQPVQTYPAQTAAGHAPAPATDDPATMAANAPETAETNAGDPERRIEQHPNTAHRTGGRDGGGADAADPSIRNEKQVVADSQAEFPDESTGRTFEWRDGNTVPNETSGRIYYTPQETPPNAGQRGKHKALAMTVAAAGVGSALVAMARRRRAREK